MNRNLIPFLFLAGVLIIALGGAAFRYFWRIRTSPHHEWESLLERLVEINREGIDRVALDSIEPTGRRRTDELARELEPEQIWELLGGIVGVERMESNSRVLIEMADFLQRSYPDAAMAAKELRRQAAELKWQVERLRMAVDQGSLEFHLTTYAPNVAIEYYLMEHRLHTLCTQINVPTFRNLH